MYNDILQLCDVVVFAIHRQILSAKLTIGTGLPHTRHLHRFTSKQLHDTLYRHMIYVALQVIYIPKKKS